MGDATCQERSAPSAGVGYGGTVKANRASVCVAALFPMGLAACERDQGQPREGETATAPMTQNNDRQPVRGTGPSAAQEIAQARCAREMKCNNIGQGREYASEQVCLTRIQAEWREDLNARECPGGINRDELNECLQEIRNNNCDNPIDSLGSFVACRQSDICRALR